MEYFALILHEIIFLNFILVHDRDYSAWWSSNKMLVEVFARIQTGNGMKFLNIFFVDIYFEGRYFKSMNYDIVL